MATTPDPPPGPDDPDADPAGAAVDSLARAIELLATEDVRMGGDHAELVRDGLGVLARTLVVLYRREHGQPADDS